MHPEGSCRVWRGLVGSGRITKVSGRVLRDPKYTKRVLPTERKKIPQTTGGIPKVSRIVLKGPEGSKGVLKGPEGSKGVLMCP